MYGGASNDHQKDMQQTFHAYEKEFGDIWGLTAQNDFLSIFTKNR